MITEYPVDVGVYDWAVTTGAFRPGKPRHSSSEFIGGFMTAAQESADRALTYGRPEPKAGSPITSPRVDSEDCIGSMRILSILIQRMSIIREKASAYSRPRLDLC
jgi:hypothetical protein